jgi:hypothetical protein
MSPLARLTLAVAAFAATSADAATFAELSGGPSPDYGAFVAGPYTTPPYGPPAAPAYGQPGPYAPYSAANPQGPVAPPAARGQEGAPPVALDAPAFPPPAPPPRYASNGPGAAAPNGPLTLASFQQVNSTTDPYNAWGLSTPFMFVPWSTPLSGWTNAQTWNWWRERSGAPSYGW